MKKMFLFVLGICLVVDGATCYATVGNDTVPGEIGRFVALRGANGTNGTNGTDCRPTETRTRCYGTGSSKCDDTTRSGVKIVTTQCDGSGPTTSYIYDNNCGITVASTTDVHQDNDSNKPVTHKRVAFKNTCTNEPIATTADVPVGCTPTYTQKYINKETNGSFTYDNASRSEKTIGVRVTVSGCGNENSFDTYDGNDGTSFNYLGSVENCNALNNISNPAQNDAYIVNGDGQGKLCIYNGSSWPTTCPDDCAEFTGPAGDNNCTGLETSSTAVKNTALTYYGPTKSDSGLSYYTTKGKMTTSHTPCNPNVTLDDSVQDDPCVIIAAPADSGCTGANNTYYECKRQGAQGSNAAGTTYNLCLTTTGNSITSALDNPCYGVAAANQSTTVKKTEWSYTAPDGSAGIKTSVGKLVQKNRMCDNSLSTSSLAEVEDECTEEARPSSGCDGTGKVYKKCRPQGTYASNMNFSDYYVCVDGTYKDVCLGTASSSLSTTERTQSTAYTAPSGTKTGSGDYSYYTSSPGKMVTTSVKCNPGTNGGNNTVIGSVLDPCDEIAKPSNVCPDTNKKFYKCRPQGKISSSTDPYYLCTNPLGVSVLDTINSAAQSAAETAVAAVDPCASVANGSNDQKKAQIKSMNSTYTLQTVSSGNDRTAVGYSTLTKTTCATGADATQVEYQYDTCKEIADTRTSGACSGNDKVYLECVNQTKASGDSGYTYKVCQTVTANTSLSGKITAAQTVATNAATAAAAAQTTAAGKIDASYLITNGYLTSTSSLNAGNLTGMIDAGRLPDTVVTVGNDATHGFNTLLGNSVSTAVTDAINTEISNGSEGVFKDFVTNDTLASAVSTEVESAISEKSVTFGDLQITLDEALELLGAAAGTCTRSSGGFGGADGTVSCSGGGLGSVSTTGKD